MSMVDLIELTAPIIAGLATVLSAIVNLVSRRKRQSEDARKKAL